VYVATGEGVVRRVREREAAELQAEDAVESGAEAHAEKECFVRRDHETMLQATVVNPLLADALAPAGRASTSHDQ
jgi:hypothetical protein